MDWPNVLANPGRIVPVTVHSDFLATPYDEDQDLRTNDANEIANNLGPVNSKPSCFINRKIYNGQRLLNSPGIWSGFVNAELALQSNVDLQLEIVSYDLLERTIRYRATLSYAAAAQNHNLGFFITESKIEATQLDLTVKVHDYEHEYVLRKTLTYYIGDPVLNDIVPNLVIIKEFEIDLDDYDAAGIWKLENMELVAFIRQSDDAIVQANTVKVAP